MFRLLFCFLASGQTDSLPLNAQEDRRREKRFACLHGEKEIEQDQRQCVCSVCRDRHTDRPEKQSVTEKKIRPLQSWLCVGSVAITTIDSRGLELLLSPKYTSLGLEERK